MNNKIIKRGDIFYTDLSPVVGSEQGGVRPVIIIQNNVGNKCSSCVIVAAITSQINKAKLPTHVEISGCGLSKNSVILLEQIRTLDKRRLGDYIGTVNDELLNKVDDAILTSMGIPKMKIPEYEDKIVKRIQKYITYFINLEQKHINDNKKVKQCRYDIKVFSDVLQIYKIFSNKNMNRIKNKELIGA